MEAWKLSLDLMKWSSFLGRDAMTPLTGTFSASASQPKMLGLLGGSF